MVSSSVPVVTILDDDDEEVVPTPVAVIPPSSSNRKRSHGASSSSRDAFSSSPPLHKRLQLAAADPICLDDTPPPPRPRRPSSTPQQLPVQVVDDDTEPSPVPKHQGAPELNGSRPIIDHDIVVPETPGFASPSSSRPPAARRLSSKSSAASAFIPLDIDDDGEPDEALYRELTGSPIYAVAQDDGTATYGQSLHTDSPHEGSTPDADAGTGKNRPQEVKKRQNEEQKLKRQEAKKIKEDEKAKKAEERKQKQEARKAELADKKRKKEVNKWESGKYALKCITAVIDTNVAESGSIGGLLLQGLEEKGLKKKMTKNPIDRSILWKMEVPSDIAQELSGLNDDCAMDQSSVIELPYIAIVFQAEEFCDLVNKETIFSHVQDVRKKYPTHTICYITNKLMSHINKWEQIHYKNKTTNWKRPAVEEVFCRMATHYPNVHSMQCVDEAEVAEHIVGLTLNLAKCKFRKQSTWLSVKANGAVVPDNFIDKDLAKKDPWLKSLIAIPGVQPKNAVAIWKEYPSMRSLLNVYMDPNKTVIEKERLLSDLKWKDRLGDVGKRLGPKCSNRVYRMLMAENGDLDTDSTEAGA